MESYDRLVQLVQDVTDDMAKCEGGNKAAGTRVRKAMQDIKAAAQDVRKDVLGLRNSDGYLSTIDERGPSQCLDLFL